ncbi:cadherin-23 [Aplysia californica]|uniref:Cadherin-23 n=1 Tax=Aplysia californica TaxID=6500 RepID=A0ABM1VQ93_APLCA|nr:cadherin-23 [Aplysia californica]
MATASKKVLFFCNQTSCITICKSCLSQLTIIALLFIAQEQILAQGFSNNPPIPGDYEATLVVEEDTPIGDVIGNITASDDDGQPLTFKTSTPDTTQLVELSSPRDVPGIPRTKVVDIILKSVLDRDFAPTQRRLYFSVSDGESSVPLWITLFIKDVNDVAPQFVNLPYEVTIKEDTLPGTVIFSGVSAKDPDNGRGASYTMESDAQAADIEYLRTFEIKPYNGNISLLLPLDYEKHSYYQFKITAEDEGGLKAEPAGFVVYVLDVQDSPPTFVNLPYSTEIDEDKAKGASVQQVVAVDGDSGIPNDITYSFVSGEYANFDIDSTTGVISIKETLNRDSETMRNTGGVYAMIVQAAEIVPPEQVNNGETTATTLVTITVRDVNDNAPTFSQNNYKATILENMQQNVPVGFEGNIMRVSDIDQGTNSHFSVTFQKGGEPFDDFSPQPQEIYSESSVFIRVNNSTALDYEKNQRVIFEVVARELDTVEKRSSTATVTIEIEDMNDNAPEFSSSNYTLDVEENTVPGTSVAVYTATDLDSGSFGEIKYSLRGGNGRFSIEENTGILRVTGNVDREENQEFYLTVEAQDGGGLRTPAEIAVTVLDKNDNEPVFKRDDYDGIIREGDVDFVRPLKVEAIDNDASNTPNSLVSYQIVNAPPGLSENFTIDSSTGEITLTDPLDYETLDPALNGKVTLTVEAYDAGDPVRSSQVFVNITVEDENDFRPQFSEKNYTTDIPENSDEGFVVKTVTATDLDGTSPNNDFIYRIESGAFDKFRIDFKTGAVEVEKRADLDRESKGEYTLSISAIDRGTPPLTGRCILTIRLNDINDETPVFDMETASTEIPENTAVGSTFYTFGASDPDLESNLEYHLGEVSAFSGEKGSKPLNVTATGVKTYFGIGLNTGKVFVRNELDRETAERIILEIVVEDKNAQEGEQTATGTLTVTLSDSNDNAPQFSQPGGYTVDVPESESLQSIVLQVSSTDADDGQVITYSIGTATFDAFTISNDGTIRLKNELDREKDDQVEFEVIATDNGVQPLSSTATVTIVVLDANDNAPIFDPNHKVNFEVAEDVAVGFPVTRITATDLDDGDFGTVHYALVGPDTEDGMFAIDEDTGEISVAKELDREVKALYKFEVEATDSMLNPEESESARSRITVVIKDVNDNQPEFTQVIPDKPTVPESFQGGQNVATVVANDKDDPTTDSGKILFSLGDDTNATSVTGSPLFQISSAGVISASIGLSGYSGFYYVTVVASNPGGPAGTEKQVVIQVLDVNDETPRFVKPSQDNDVAYVMENSETGTFVFQLEAQDNDAGDNGVVRYSILPLPNSDMDGSSQFAVDAVTGIITTVLEVNAELQSRYELRVQAADQGFPTPAKTSLTLIVVVQDKNDHKPEFVGLSAPHVIRMKENETSCANVSLAIDRDLNTTFTVICYYLIGVDVPDKFTLGRQDGQLCLKTPLDRETTPYVNVVILALEECYRSDIPTQMISMGIGDLFPAMYRPAHTNKTWIKLQVTDINDNPPVFRTKDLALGVTRVTQFGKFILELRNDVEDKDTALWGIDYFEITSEFEAHPAALKKELEDLGVKEPFKLFRNGSVKTNMYFKPQMSGFFTVNLRVYDKGRLYDDARLRISLINDDQRLIIIFRRSIDSVGPLKDEIVKRLSDKLNYRIVVDSIQTHETETGAADLAKTDMFIHGEDFETNEVIPAARLLSIIDQKSALLISLLNDYNVLQVIPTYKENLDDGLEDKLKMALILVSVVLGSICVILAIILYYTYKRYQRKLKAATAMAYVNSGCEPKESDLYKADIPGTNIHSFENANPIFLEKMMLDNNEDGNTTAA